MVSAATETLVNNSEGLTREQVEANIKALREAAADAYKVYDRAFRHIGANDAECGEAYGAWMRAQDAWQEALYQRDLRAYQFAELIGTAGFLVRPKRSSYF